MGKPRPPRSQSQLVVSVATGVDLGTAPAPGIVLTSAIGWRFEQIELRLRGRYLPPVIRLADNPDDSPGGSYSRWTVGTALGIAPRAPELTERQAPGDIRLSGWFAIDLGEITWWRTRIGETGARSGGVACACLGGSVWDHGDSVA